MNVHALIETRDSRSSKESDITSHVSPLLPCSHIAIA